jgi:hypothetical protein
MFSEVAFTISVLVVCLELVPYGLVHIWWLRQQKNGPSSTVLILQDLMADAAVLLRGSRLFTADDSRIATGDTLGAGCASA